MLCVELPDAGQGVASSLRVAGSIELFKAVQGDFGRLGKYDPEVLFSWRRFPRKSHTAECECLCLGDAFHGSRKRILGKQSTTEEKRKSGGQVFHAVFLPAVIAVASRGGIPAFRRSPAQLGVV